MEISTAINLSECSPNLMPFHISHSGSAPVSAYFRVKPSPSSAHLSLTQKSSNGINSNRDSSQNNPIAEETQCSQATVVGSQSVSPEEDSQDSTAVAGAIVVGTDYGIHASSPELASAQPVLPTEGSSPGNNFVAAFRGRQVHGRTVNLPHGYGGIVLGGGQNQAGCTEVAEKMTQTKGKGRATRQTSRIYDDDISVEPGQGGVPNDAEIERLTPISRFSSLTVWSPDIPVDEGKDEYIRSLTEWTKLAAEVCFHVIWASVN